MKRQYLVSYMVTDVVGLRETRLVETSAHPDQIRQMLSWTGAFRFSIAQVVALDTELGDLRGIALWPAGHLLMPTLWFDGPYWTGEAEPASSEDDRVFFHSPTLARGQSPSMVWMRLYTNRWSIARDVMGELLDHWSDDRLVVDRTTEHRGEHLFAARDHLRRLHERDATPPVKSHTMDELERAQALLRRAVGHVQQCLEGVSDKSLERRARYHAQMAELECCMVECDLQMARLHEGKNAQEEPTCKPFT